MDTRVNRKILVYLSKVIKNVQNAMIPSIANKINIDMLLKYIPSTIDTRAVIKPEKMRFFISSSFILDIWRQSL